MPKISRRTHTKNHTKRHGRHHKRTGHYVKVYAPYLPLVICIVASLLLTFYHPSAGNTLAYATEVSTSGLLSSTNSQRASNGVGSLTVNGQLNSAAQAKANDMIARNYWSHTTPDGEQPWVFIDATGYKYTKAGENLAYGFTTSGDTVSGWMNSPSHKANMLDSGFTDVGFGFANGSNYNGDGEETVVVAMYGKPQVAAATTPPPVQSTTPTAPKPSAPAAPAPQTPPPVAAPIKQKAEEEPTPITTDEPQATAEAQPQQIAQVETITKGQTPWAMAALGTALMGIALFKLLHHSLKFRHLLKDGEKFILHHPLLDSTLLGLTILGLTLMQTVGSIL